MGRWYAPTVPSAPLSSSAGTPRRLVTSGPPRYPAGATMRSSVTTGDWFTRSPEV